MQKDTLVCVCKQHDISSALFSLRLYRMVIFRIKICHRKRTAELYLLITLVFLFAFMKLIFQIKTTNMLCLENAPTPENTVDAVHFCQAERIACLENPCL